MLLTKRKAGGGRKPTTIKNKWSHIPLNILIKKVDRYKQKTGIKVDTDTVAQVLKAGGNELTFKHLHEYGCVSTGVSKRIMTLLTYMTKHDFTY